MILGQLNMGARHTIYAPLGNSGSGLTGIPLLLCQILFEMNQVQNTAKFATYDDDYDVDGGGVDDDDGDPSPFGRC